jgi:spore germination protein YaaH
MADFVIMMGYDEHWAGGAAGSTASIGFTETTISLALNKVPAEKLIHGIPFYTRVWGDENGKTVSSTAAGMGAAKELLEKNGASLKWLEKEGQFFGEYVSEGIRYRIWLEDTTSLKLKLDLIEANGLAGVACWKLGLEDKAVWPLIADCLD